MTELLQLDHQLFDLINGEWHNTFLDTIMPYWREKKFWIPAYVFLGLFVFIRYRWYGLYFALALVLTVGVADTVSSRVIKKSVKRLRPCNDPEIKEEVFLRAGCGNGYSFTSSHATNHFAMAAFIAFTLGLLFPWLRLILFLWAAGVAYGQVYVGVHFPLDVVVGSIVGTLIGFLIAKAYLASSLRIPALSSSHKSRS